MNFATVRHLVLKDVRHQRIRLLLIWLAAFFVPLTNFFQDERLMPLMVTVKLGVVFCFYLLIIFTLVSVILLDPTCGSSRFLKTRPIEWPAMLASKMLFVLVFLYSPIFIFRLVTIWISGVHLSLADQGLCALEMALIASGVAALFVFPALFFQRMATVIMVIVGCVAGTYVLVIFFGVLANTLGFGGRDLQAYGLFMSPEENHASVLVSGFLLVCTVLGLTIIPVALLRYWRPDVAIPFTLVCGGFFLSFVYFCYVPFLVDQFFSDYIAPPDVGELPQALSDQLHFQLESLTWDTSRSWDDSNGAKKRLESHLIEKLTIGGLNNRYFPREIESNLHIFLPSGKKPALENIERKENPSSAQYISNYLSQQCASDAPDTVSDKNYDLDRVMTFYGHNDYRLRPDIADSELKDASVHEKLIFMMDRVKILKILPFRDGVRTDSLRSCFEIRRVVEEGGVIRYLQNNSSVLLMLRGDPGRLAGPMADSFPSFVVINRKTGEILDDSSSSNSDDPFGPNLSWMTLSRFRPKGQPPTSTPPPLPTGWLNDADICFYEIEDVGTVTFSYSKTATNFLR